MGGRRGEGGEGREERGGRRGEGGEGKEERGGRRGEGGEGREERDRKMLPQTPGNPGFHGLVCISGLQFDRKCNL